jgi:DNA-binding HxlR family transcriptional regulator
LKLEHQYCSLTYVKFASFLFSISEMKIREFRIFLQFLDIRYIFLPHYAKVSLYSHSVIYRTERYVSLMEQRSVVDILKAISDNWSLDIFQSIAKGTVESELLKQKEGLSKKQYYFRTRQLLDAGLVQRVKGRFSLTNLGTVIYHAQLIMEAGVNNYWKLKAIDSIQGSAQIGEQERIKLIKTILSDDQIEGILVKQS